MKKVFRNNSFDLKNSETYKPSPVAAARWTELPDGGFKYNNDVKLLFNQERIAKLVGADSLSSWLGTLDNNYRQSVDTSKLPDKVVLDFVKSRNIQSPSELLAWSEYLNSCAEELVNKYNDEQMRNAAAQLELQAKQQASKSEESTETQSTE